jgi:hypothetical protein
MAMDTLLAYVGVYGDGCWQGPQPAGRSSAQLPVMRRPA